MSYREIDPTAIEPLAIVVYSAPATGATINMNRARSQILLINPAGTIAALTVNFPSSPIDGDRIRIGCSKIVVALTMSGSGASLISGLTTMALGGFGQWIYNSSVTTWFRIG